MQIQDHLKIKPYQTRIIQIGRTLMNVCMCPARKMEPKAATKLQDHQKHNKALEQIGNAPHSSKAEISKKIQNLFARVANLDTYLHRMTNLHRQLEHNQQEGQNPEENQNYIVRRQMNVNLDDFYRPQFDVNEINQPEDAGDCMDVKQNLMDELNRNGGLPIVRREGAPAAQQMQVPQNEAGRDQGAGIENEGFVQELRVNLVRSIHIANQQAPENQ